MGTARAAPNGSPATRVGPATRQDLSDAPDGMLLAAHSGATRAAAHGDLCAASHQRGGGRAARRREKPSARQPWTRPDPAGNECAVAVDRPPRPAAAGRQTG